MTAANRYPFFSSDRKEWIRVQEYREKEGRAHYFTDFDASKYSVNEDFQKHKELLQKWLRYLNPSFILSIYNPSERQMNSEYRVMMIVRLILEMSVIQVNIFQGKAAYTIIDQYPLLVKRQKVDYAIVITGLLGLPIKVVIETKRAGFFRKQTQLLNTLGQGYEYAKRAVFLNQKASLLEIMMYKGVILIVTDLESWHFFAISPFGHDKYYSKSEFALIHYEEVSYLRIEKSFEKAFNFFNNTIPHVVANALCTEHSI